MNRIEQIIGRVRIYLVIKTYLIFKEMFKFINCTLLKKNKVDLYVYRLT